MKKKKKITNTSADFETGKTFQKNTSGSSDIGTMLVPTHRKYFKAKYYLCLGRNV